MNSMTAAKPGVVPGCPTRTRPSTRRTRIAEAPGRLPIVEKPLRAMHLAQALPAEHGAAASHVKREIAAEVLDRRSHASRGVERRRGRARRRHVRLAGRRAASSRREARLVAGWHRFGVRHRERVEMCRSTYRAHGSPLAAAITSPSNASRRWEYFHSVLEGYVALKFIGKLRREARLGPPRARAGRAAGPSCA